MRKELEPVAVILGITMMLSGPLLTLKLPTVTGKLNGLAIGALGLFVITTWLVFQVLEIRQHLREDS